MRSGDESSKNTPGKRDVGAGSPQTGAAVKRAGGDRDMGAALRTVYQRAVDEAIPPEMLDLLGKLD